MRRIFLTIALMLICTGIVNSAPALHGMAINPETEECAGYWPGDEFDQYDLPDGWKPVFPNYSRHVTNVKTDFGSCEYEGTDYDHLDSRFLTVDEARDCCKKLGFSFIFDNFSGRAGKDARIDEILDTLHWIAANNETKECTAVGMHEKTSNSKAEFPFNYLKIPDGWVIYPSDTPYSIIETEKGKCYIGKYDYESCCRRLGYEYVSDNIGKKKVTAFAIQNLILNPLVLVLLASVVIVALILLWKRK